MYANPRQAPLPPSPSPSTASSSRSRATSCNTRLPASHPFATYYVPPPRLASLPNDSTSSFESAVPTSLASSSKSYTSRRSQPTSALAAPLTPKRPQHLGHYSFPCPQPRPALLPSRSVADLSVLARNTPRELGILDAPRPQENLLNDLELITGKKLRFPFLSKIRGEKKRKEDKGKKLRKERVMSYDEEFFFTADMGKERKYDWI